MQALKTQFRTLTAALAIGALGLTAPLSANAIATYSAQSELILTVRDKQRAQVEGWGEVFDFDELTTGNASASASWTTNPDMPTVLDIGDTLTLISSSSGTAVDGTAESFVFLDAFLRITGQGSQDGFVELGFEFILSVEELVDNPTVEIADGFAEIFLEDLLDVSLDSPGQISDSGIWVIDTVGGVSDFRVGEVNSEGLAAAPEPTTIALLGLGLAVLGYRLRKQLTA